MAAGDERLDRIDQTLTSILVRLTAIELQNTGAASLATDHEHRLRGVERWTLAIPASVISATVGSLSAAAVAAFLR
jgi:hypothetical protein